MHCMNTTQTFYLTHCMGSDMRSHLQGDPYFSVWLSSQLHQRIPPPQKKKEEEEAEGKLCSTVPTPLYVLQE